jgi:2-polyprenyl-6-hydroxyphenyl methylase/3-demethylubiquinone-9 3-methyltransferase
LEIGGHMTETKIQGFAFGENWKNFLRILSNEHIHEAEKALAVFLGTTDLTGKRFLDIGSGSGLQKNSCADMLSMRNNGR